jgi:hypothetical protein
LIRPQYSFLNYVRESRIADQCILPLSQIKITKINIVYLDELSNFGIHDCQGLRPGQICKGATQAVCRLKEGSRTPSFLDVLRPTCQVGQGSLTGRRVFWQFGPICRGRLIPWLVGTQGYPCLSTTFSAKII